MGRILLPASFSALPITLLSDPSMPTSQWEGVYIRQTLINKNTIFIFQDKESRREVMEGVGVGGRGKRGLSLPTIFVTSGSMCEGHLGFLANSYTAGNSFLHSLFPISQSSLISLCSCFTELGILCHSSLAWSLSKQKREKEGEKE